MKNKLRAGKSTLGAWMTIPSMAIAEIVCSRLEAIQMFNLIDATIF
jgi:hypothetical protein